MRLRSLAIAAGVAAATLVLGAGIASAQDEGDDTTTTEVSDGIGDTVTTDDDATVTTDDTTDTETDTADLPDEGCDEAGGRGHGPRDGDDGTDNGGTGDTGTTTDTTPEGDSFAP